MREMLQQLSVAIRRATARATLRRLGEPPPATGPSQARDLLAAVGEAAEEDFENLDGLFG